MSTERPIIDDDRNLPSQNARSSSNKSKTWADRYRGAASYLEKKRFHLSLDETWKKRLHVVKEAVQELQEQHPEIIGLSFYGSTTKGYATAESDLDALIFLDGEKVGQDERVALERTGAIDLSEELKRNIYKRLGEEHKPELSFTVRILDRDGIDHTLEELLRGVEARGNTGQDMDNLVPYFGHKCERLGELFTGINVGDKILEYRKDFLEKLLSHGETGQMLWREIIGYVRKKERPILRPGFEDNAVHGNKYEDLYPQTLEQAMKYFVERKPWRTN